MSTRAWRDHGQATAELALALPVVVVLLLAIVQVGVLVRDQVLVVHAAREAARAAAVADGDGRDARAAALGSVGLPSDAVEVGTRRTGGAAPAVTVTVTYTSPTDLPLIGRVLGDVVLTGRATMRLEP